MPNWCENLMQVYGPRDALNAFKEAVKGEETGLDFHKILPVPEVLADTMKGCTNIDGKKVEAWHEARIDEETYKKGVAEALPDVSYETYKPEGQDPIYVKKWPVSALEARRAGGHFTAFDWQVAKWGTKWGVDATITQEGNTYLEYGFDSAWSPPVGIYEALATQYPNLAITANGQEPGCAFTYQYDVNGYEVSDMGPYEENEDGEYEYPILFSPIDPHHIDWDKRVGFIEEAMETRPWNPEWQLPPHGREHLSWAFADIMTHKQVPATREAVHAQYEAYHAAGMAQEDIITIEKSPERLADVERGR